MRYIQFLSCLVLGFLAVGLAVPVPGEDTTEIDAGETCEPNAPTAHGTLNSRDEVKPRCII
ncbi:hypothetical protein F4821DRAFT_264436 [Hypoxylon rubiginosum]|uniref:Uncharacterized protein n=1 Tax=Hypoxylon rubiginosum TaxID=110542 RepID=A0ACC0CNU0_9PEZI|nr:hypothetical protein F4821DRAFT_264436 [Hypoxylon rubiginosum]